jgi:hypothetical protein
MTQPPIPISRSVSGAGPRGPTARPEFLSVQDHRARGVLPGLPHSGLRPNPSTAPGDLDGGGLYLVTTEPPVESRLPSDPNLN